MILHVNSEPHPHTIFHLSIKANLIILKETDMLRTRLHINKNHKTLQSQFIDPKFWINVHTVYHAKKTVQFPNSYNLLLVHVMFTPRINNQTIILTKNAPTDTGISNVHTELHQTIERVVLSNHQKSSHLIDCYP